MHIMQLAAHSTLSVAAAIQLIAINYCASEATCEIPQAAVTFQEHVTYSFPKCQYDTSLHAFVSDLNTTPCWLTLLVYLTH